VVTVTFTEVVDTVIDEVLDVLAEEINGKSLIPKKYLVSYP
jgi:hypothetical protein